MSVSSGSQLECMDLAEEIGFDHDKVCVQKNPRETMRVISKMENAKKRKRVSRVNDLVSEFRLERSRSDKDGKLLSELREIVASTSTLGIETGPKSSQRISKKNLDLVGDAHELLSENREMLNDLLRENRSGLDEKTTRFPLEHAKRISEAYGFELIDDEYELMRKLHQISRVLGDIDRGRRRPSKKDAFRLKRYMEYILELSRLAL